MSETIEGIKKKNPMISIFFTIFLDLLGFGLIIPVMAPLVVRNEAGIIPMHFTEEDRKIIFGLLMAIYALAQFFSNSLLGAISDRIGRRKTLIFSLFVTLIGYVFLTGGIHTKSIVLVILGRIVPGLAAGNIGICYSAIADVSTPETKTKNFAMIGVAFGLGFILGPFLGGILSNSNLVSWFRYDTPFFATVFLSVINIFISWFNFEETLKERKDSKLTLFTGIKNINKAFMHPTLKNLYLLVFIYNLGFAFFTTFFTVFLIDKFQFKEQDIGPIFGYMGLCIVFGQGYFVRKISNKYPPQQIAKIFLPIMAISFLAVILVNQWEWLLLILPFVAISQSATGSSTTALISNYAGKGVQGEILGITMSMNSLSQGIPGLIGGKLSGMNINYPTILATILAFVGWFILLRFLNKSHETVENIE